MTVTVTVPEVHPRSQASTPVGFRRLWQAALAACVLATGLGHHSQPSAAQGIPLIRDTEIENLLSDYAQPIFKVAGLSGGRVKVRIVRNNAFNAFVIDGRNVFIHTGALSQAATPNEVIGVLAHEAGHIAGGHLAALRTRIAKDQTRALLAQILGIGAMVAGGVAGGDSGRDALAGGQAIMQGGNEIIMRGLLSERRSQESAADQAGLQYLNATKQSGQGMLRTFERFQEQEYVSEQFKDPFVRSHPVATQRLARLREAVQASPYFGVTDSPQLQLRHDMMKAKLAGYLEPPSSVLARYPAKDNSLPARYARGIAHFFKGGSGALESAIAELDSLIADNPNYPYFHEVKGDLYMRSGRNGEAVPHLRRALKLAPDGTLIAVQLATALLATEQAGVVDESIKLLRNSLVTDDNPRAFRMLANAYYKKGNGPRADAMTAQALFLEGNLKDAKIFAQRAHPRLKKGSPEWLKNDDIINFQPPT